MGRKLLLLTLFMLWNSTVQADTSITHYRDGAVIRRECIAVKGIIEHPGIADLVETTLSIEPAPGTRIINVETYHSPTTTGSSKEQVTLLEQRRKLEDRLQALETREAIFTSAAKSQSGKAPRKTKTNPDPMQTIRQGTEFAIAQLESVYTARRRTVHEIEKIDARSATLLKNSRHGGDSLRITVTPPRGAVTLQYATKDFGWYPTYTIHLNGSDSLRLEMSPQAAVFAKGYLRRFSPGSLHDLPPLPPLAPSASGFTPLVSYQLPLTGRQEENGIFNSLSGLLTNTSGIYLPPGNSIVFRNGSYKGKLRFNGLSSGRSRVITVGGT